MKTKHLLTRCLLMLMIVAAPILTACAQGTAFTYQGRLNDLNGLATGLYDLSFTIYDAASSGNAVGNGAITNAATPVTNGLFTVTLDFGGGVFDGNARWLEIAVQPAGGTNFTTLTPRQALTATPYAQFSGSAATALIATSANSVAGANIQGQLPLSKLPSQVLTNGVAFAGDGSGVTNVNAAALNGLSATNFWQLGGNAVSSGQIIGSTNNQAVEIWANNQRAVRIEPNSAGAPNFIAGAAVNYADPGVVGATIGGGGALNYSGLKTNSVTADFGTVSGGSKNSVNGMLGTVGGGFNNLANGQMGVIGGGLNNRNEGFGGVVGGGINNTNGTGADYGTVSGGYNNNAAGTYASVGGGLNNNAGGMYANVAGGSNNKATNQMATVGGGGNNTAATFGATVAGGLINLASGLYATVSGGNNNTASAQSSTVVGGFFSQATNSYATVAGGSYNLAGGQGSFAAGRMARAQHDGSFVWADSSLSMPFNSTTNNEFAVRAAGGVRLVTLGVGLTVDGQQVITGQNSTNYWQLGGNNVSPGQFLGSTNNQPLDLWANASRALRLQSVTTASGYSASFTGVNVIGGYAGNYVSSGTVGATIAGGGYLYWNQLSGWAAYTNSVLGNYGAVGGGYNNMVGDSGVVAGGHDNLAGNSATVPGGQNNQATGYGSFAAGISAYAWKDHAFIWNDGSAPAFSSSANSFDIFASGGIHINKNDLYLGITNDVRHGLGYRSSVAGSSIDGPFLYGNSGGALGTTTPTAVALQWDASGNVTVNNACNVASFRDYGAAVISGNAWIYGNSYLSSLNAAGDANFSGNVWIATNCSMASLTIRGGADLAEPFNFTSGSGDVSEGAVVVIDEQHPGRLKLSNKPYDTHVAGVVSGANGINPGIQMHQQGLIEGGKNVALTGRVYVQADAANGAIAPGDMLTTSSSPGFAMKVTDHIKSVGAILGKAMSGLNDGKGLVLVLVTLQ